jgi:hypothetical protein
VRTLQQQLYIPVEENGVLLLVGLASGECGHVFVDNVKAHSTIPISKYANFGLPLAVVPIVRMGMMCMKRLLLLLHGIVLAPGALVREHLVSLRNRNELFRSSLVVGILHQLMDQSNGDG